MTRPGFAIHLIKTVHVTFLCICLWATHIPHSEAFTGESCTLGNAKSILDAAQHNCDDFGTCHTTGLEADMDKLEMAMNIYPMIVGLATGIASALVLEACPVPYVSKTVFMVGETAYTVGELILMIAAWFLQEEMQAGLQAVLDKNLNREADAQKLQLDAYVHMWKNLCITHHYIIGRLTVQAIGFAGYLGGAAAAIAEAVECYSLAAATLGVSEAVMPPFCTDICGGAAVPGSETGIAAGGGAQGAAAASKAGKGADAAAAAADAGGAAKGAGAAADAGSAGAAAGDASGAGKLGGAASAAGDAGSGAGGAGKAGKAGGAAGDAGSAGAAASDAGGTGKAGGAVGDAGDAGAAAGDAADAGSAAKPPKKKGFFRRVIDKIGDGIGFLGDKAEGAGKKLGGRGGKGSSGARSVGAGTVDVPDAQSTTSRGAPDAPGGGSARSADAEAPAPIPDAPEGLIVAKPDQGPPIPGVGPEGAPPVPPKRGPRSIIGEGAGEVDGMDIGYYSDVEPISTKPSAAAGSRKRYSRGPPSADPVGGDAYPGRTLSLSDGDAAPAGPKEWDFGPDPRTSWEKAADGVDAPAGSPPRRRATAADAPDTLEMEAYRKQMAEKKQQKLGGVDAGDLDDVDVVGDTGSVDGPADPSVPPPPEGVPVQGQPDDLAPSVPAPPPEPGPAPLTTTSLPEVPTSPGLGGGLDDIDIAGTSGLPGGASTTGPAQKPMRPGSAAGADVGAPGPVAGGGPSPGKVDPAGGPVVSADAPAGGPPRQSSPLGGSDAPASGGGAGLDDLSFETPAPDGLAQVDTVPAPARSPGSTPAVEAVPDAGARPGSSPPGRSRLDAAIGDAGGPGPIDAPEAGPVQRRADAGDGAGASDAAAPPDDLQPVVPDAPETPREFGGVGLDDVDAEVKAKADEASSLRDRADELQQRRQRELNGEDVDSVDPAELEDAIAAADAAEAQLKNAELEANFVKGKGAITDADGNVRYRMVNDDGTAVEYRMKPGADPGDPYTMEVREIGADGLPVDGQEFRPPTRTERFHGKWRGRLGTTNGFLNSGDATMGVADSIPDPLLEDGEGRPAPPSRPEEDTLDAELDEILKNPSSSGGGRDSSFNMSPKNFYKYPTEYNFLKEFMPMPKPKQIDALVGLKGAGARAGAGPHKIHKLMQDFSRFKMLKQMMRLQHEKAGLEEGQLHKAESDIDQLRVALFEGDSLKVLNHLISFGGYITSLAINRAEARTATTENEVLEQEYDYLSELNQNLVNEQDEARENWRDSKGSQAQKQSAADSGYDTGSSVMSSGEAEQMGMDIGIMVGVGLVLAFLIYLAVRFLKGLFGLIMARPSARIAFGFTSAALLTPVIVILGIQIHIIQTRKRKIEAVYARMKEIQGDILKRMKSSEDTIRKNQLQIKINKARMEAIEAQVEANNERPAPSGTGSGGSGSGGTLSGGRAQARSVFRAAGMAVRAQLREGVGKSSEYKKARESFCNTPSVAAYATAQGCPNNKPGTGVAGVDDMARASGVPMPDMSTPVAVMNDALAGGGGLLSGDLAPQVARFARAQSDNAKSNLDKYNAGMLEAGLEPFDAKALGQETIKGLLEDTAKFDQMAKAANLDFGKGFGLGLSDSTGADEGAQGEESAKLAEANASKIGTGTRRGGQGYTGKPKRGGANFRVRRPKVKKKDTGLQVNMVKAGKVKFHKSETVSQSKTSSIFKLISTRYRKSAFDYLLTE